MKFEKQSSTCSPATPHLSAQSSSQISASSPILHPRHWALPTRCLQPWLQPRPLRGMEEKGCPPQGWLKADSRGALKFSVSGPFDATAPGSAVAAKLSEAKQIPPRAACCRGQGGSIPAWQCTVCGRGRRVGKVKRKSEKHSIKWPSVSPLSCTDTSLDKLTGVLV